MRNKKLQVWLPLLFSVVMILGMFYGYKLGDGQGFFSVKKQTSLQQALETIKTYYVDTVNTDSLQAGAIQKMMSELDPHSVYFPPVESKQALKDLEGRFEGIGIEYNIFDDTLNVVYVIPGGPSDVGGLRIGDKIIAVDNTPLTSKNLSPENIKEKVRGIVGSVAVLQVLRNGEIKTFKVTRGSFPVSSIDAAYMIDKNTGYIKLNKFTATSYEDFMKSLEDLQKQGLQKLIFDLRDNGGGYMEDAIEICDEFLDADKLIVYTQGMNSKKHEYRCRRPGLFEKGELVILIDELSASASEVVAGAVQDWCRGTIIGRRSFGKGLVQQQFELNDGSALRLTVARYYTPVGRSIQRPYDHGKKIYMDEISQRFLNGEVLYADSNKVHNGKTFQTVCGDSVYGGGGIMPSVFVPIDTFAFPLSINRFFMNGTVNSFVYHWYLKNKTAVDKYSSATEFAEHFTQADALWNDFVTYVSNPENLQSLSVLQKNILQNRIQANLARFKWRNLGYIQVANHNDLVVNAALKKLKP